MPKQKNDIAVFIDKFKFAYQKELEYVFTSGNCYFFAVILHDRYPESEIMYDEVVNHFFVKYNGRYYDITGDVTGQFAHVIPWNQFDDHRERIIRDCIHFITR